MGNIWGGSGQGLPLGISVYHAIISNNLKIEEEEYVRARINTISKHILNCILLLCFTVM